MNVDRLLLCLLALALAGCPARDAELGSLIEEADQRSVATTGSRDTARPASNVRVNPYQKREGLHIDMPYLAGREFDAIDPEDVAEQLGVEVSREELAPQHAHVVYDKAEIWMLDGVIYRVRSPLAHPMDIPTALGVSGFPLSLGTPIDATNVVRWNRKWGTRRIELVRTEEDRRLFGFIDVWDFLPREKR